MFYIAKHYCYCFFSNNLIRINSIIQLSIICVMNRTLKCNNKTSNARTDSNQNQPLNASRMHCLAALISLLTPFQNNVPNLKQEDVKFFFYCSITEFQLVTATIITICVETRIHTYFEVLHPYTERHQRATSFLATAQSADP